MKLTLAMKCLGLEVTYFLCILVLSMHSHILYLPKMSLQMKCFNEECGFDGGEGYCLPGNTTADPWQNCPSADQCRRVSGNGQCDPECNSRDCLFDSYECVPPRLECPEDTA